MRRLTYVGITLQGLYIFLFPALLEYMCQWDLNAFLDEMSFQTVFVKVILLVEEKNYCLYLDLNPDF